ncbi:MAG: sodium-dependent transporter [Lachnospiraceae bacterium]|nr:sodium-dependent transporter [Lachnospiraceae bacterium]
MGEKRSSFSGNIGFVLAAAGSAVGLGNLWRFPYLAAQYGGGIFLLVYLILVLTFGFSLLILEIAMGRKTKLSSISAYGKLNPKFGWLGMLSLAIPVLILPYYSVIGGWVIKYMTVFLSGQGKVAADSAFFGGFIGQTASPLTMFFIFITLTIIVVAFGVEKGIERVSKFMMPVLILLTIGIAIFVATIPGAMEGLKYYLLPDFSKFSFKTLCAAMGQLFYSLSIAMGILVAYGSYVKDDIDLNKSAGHIEIFDTMVAVLSGLMIVPAVYIFSGEEGLKTGGAGLMFKTLPMVFDQMPFGNVIGGAFFVLVFLAALTSSISLTEAIVSMFMDKFKLTRIKAVLLVYVSTLLLGVPSALGYGLWSHITVLGMDFLTFFDYISNSVMMPILAIATCLLAGWFMNLKDIEDEITKNGEDFKRRGIFRVMIKYIAPVFLVIILVFYTLAQFGFISY